MSKIKLLLLFIFCKKGMTKKQTKKTLTHPAADEILNGKTITLLWPCFSFFSFSIFYWESHTYKTGKLLRCCCGGVYRSLLLLCAALNLANARVNTPRDPLPAALYTNLHEKEYCKVMFAVHVYIFQCSVFCPLVFVFVSLYLCISQYILQFGYRLIP